MQYRYNTRQSHRRVISIESATATRASRACARTYLGVVRGPVASSTVVLDVEHALHLAGGGGYEHTTPHEGSEELDGRADAEDTPTIH
jgi:hypothetical protein